MNAQQKQQLTRLIEQEQDLLAEKRVLDEHLAAVQAEIDRNRERQMQLMCAGADDELAQRSDEQAIADTGGIDPDLPACPHCLDRHNARACGPGHIDAGFEA